MDIRPTPSLASLAGTSRAQATGTDNDRSPAGGGVAESKQINDNSGIAGGTKAEDRDADGRQLLDYHSPRHSHDNPQDDTHERPHRSQSLDPSLGKNLDLDA